MPGTVTATPDPSRSSSTTQNPSSPRVLLPVRYGIERPAVRAGVSSRPVSFRVPNRRPDIRARSFFHCDINIDDMRVHPTSVLFVTLDSCRYDTFESASTPNIDRIGELHKAMAPGTFTFSSHSAMFVGHTPGMPGLDEPYANPRYGQIFRISGGGAGLEPWVALEGRNIIEGFRRLGYLTVGVGAVRWFNPNTLAARSLVDPFDKYFYHGTPFSLRSQIAFIRQAIVGLDRPLFLFMNIGETHIPYWHEGADWSVDDSPCRERATNNDAEKCRIRQRACLEWVDQELGAIFDMFEGANVLVCADHGDAWGEDGLWSHGFHHPKVFEIPLIYRLGNPPDITQPTSPRGNRIDTAINTVRDGARVLRQHLRRVISR